MLDSLFNFIIILIPLSIFIGRIIIQARSRSKQTPPPRLPVEIEENVPHWERENEDFSPHTLFRGASEYIKGLQTPAAKAHPTQKVLTAQPARAAIIPENTAAPPPVPGTKTYPAEKKTDTAVLTGGQSPVNLSRLSAMQQAVVMAEILGQPKGMM